MTKSIVFCAESARPPRRPVPIVPNILELHTSQNTGALWGFGATLPGSSLIFAGLSVIAAIVICYYLFVLGAASSRVLTVALGLIMAGAMGNCYDRLVFGYVRDFVHFHVDAIGFDCAIFNFADNMLDRRRDHPGPVRLAAGEAAATSRMPIDLDPPNRR